MIATTAWRIPGDNSDAAEVAAEVIWQAWRQAAVDRRRGSPAACLVTIARSRAIVRLRAGNSPRPLADQAMELAEQGLDPTAQIGSARRRDGSGGDAALDERELQLLDLAYCSVLRNRKLPSESACPLVR